MRCNLWNEVYYVLLMGEENADDMVAAVNTFIVF